MIPFICILLNMIISRSTYVLQKALFPFLWLSSIPLYIRTSSLSIPLSMTFSWLPRFGYCQQCYNGPSAVDSEGCLSSCHNSDLMSAGLTVQPAHEAGNLSEA